ncbi:MAG: TIGR03960 family B12-binding radical SAM protein [Desulfobacterales bacterium]|nr:MAG: TIGR03960 family B12-binding radical SAM protein [Desulfobacterales bacterium]
MRVDPIDDILALVEKASRYLGSEINAVKKDLSRVKLRFALAFPDLYEIGTSHFGLQILYHILNHHPDIAAERVFAPGVDMENHLRSAGTPIFSLESRLPLNRFDIIGFSLLYELNYTNILTILELAEIPFWASQRDLSHPLIIAGGPCACNPEPIADFFDAIVVGDGENAIMELSRTWLQWHANTPREKEDLLKQWSRIEGVYIPSYFEPHLDPQGLQILVPRYAENTRVKRTVVTDLDQVPFPEKPIIPYGKPVHDRLRLEVSRGCSRGCRFCQAGMIYRPVRERSPEKLLSLARTSVAATGYEDISLLSLSTGDYGCIAPLMQRLMARFADEHVAVSMPSLRAGTLTPELMKLIKAVRKTGFTIAPEAGSQRLRDVINKNIREKEIFDTVEDAFRLGWQLIKLYFMIGLPTESQDDLAALVDLVQALRKIKGPRGRRGQINVSVAAFIPKPHTPFQWTPQIPLEESKKIIRWIQNELKISGIHLKWQNPEVSRIEGIWARGDRRLARLLVAAYRQGCKFDGWSDQFQYRLWEAAFAETGVDPDLYTVRARQVTEPLPWDHIDTQVRKAFLLEEWQKALSGNHTPDCRQGDCNRCGVCDFDNVEPRTHTVMENEPARVARRSGGSGFRDNSYKKLKLAYSKRGQAKYFGHLELVNIFVRALKRAQIPVKFSEGFHPKPRLSFDDPLPVGMESQEEILYLTVADHVPVVTVIQGLNAHLPEGLTVIDGEVVRAGADRRSARVSSYLITLRDRDFNRNDLNTFRKHSEFYVTRATGKGKLKKINLRDMVLEIELLDTRQLRMRLRSGPEKLVRPAEVLREIFGLSGEEIKRAKIVKQKG